MQIKFGLEVKGALLKPGINRRASVLSTNASENLIIKEITINAQKAIDELAIETRNYMRETINLSRRRNVESHTDNPNERRLSTIDSLASAINILPSPNFIGAYMVGVGIISELNRYAPYWALINYGGQAKVQSPFIPGTFEGDLPDPSLKGSGTQSFSYEPNSGMGMSSKNLTVIQPKRYIETTENWLFANLPNFLKRYGLQ